MRIFAKAQLTKLYDFFMIPESIMGTFIESTLKKNNSSLHIISYIFIIVEILNILYVVFFKPQGLQNPQNFIYFTFYCILIAASILFLLLRKVLMQRSKALARIHFFMVLFIIIWSVFVNAYDLYRLPNSGITVYMTAIFGVSIVATLKPFHIFIYSMVGSVSFLCLTFETTDYIILVNVIIATLVAATVSIIKVNNTILELNHQKEMSEINYQLKTEKQQLNLNLEKFKVVVEHSRDVIFEWTLENDELKEDIIEFSNNWNEQFGYPKVIYNWHNWVINNQNWMYEGRMKIASLIENCKHSSSTTYFEEEICLSEGRWFVLRITMLFNEQQKPYKGIGSLMDINKLKNQIIYLNSKLQLDPMTSVLNKVALQSYAEINYFDKKNNSPICMLIIDLDDFKYINDNYGHPCGDYVLICVANALKLVFGETDGIARIGGDEFSVIILDENNPDIIKNRATQFMQELKNIQWQNNKIDVFCSIGIVINDKSVSNYEQLYKETDVALYKAKQMGKNCYHLSTKKCFE